MNYQIGQRVIVRAPGTPWHAKKATIAEMHTRKIDGSTRFTLEVSGREIYVSQGMFDASQE